MIIPLYGLLYGLSGYMIEQYVVQWHVLLYCSVIYGLLVIRLFVPGTNIF